MEGDAWLINSPMTLENFIHHLRTTYEKNGFVHVKAESNKKRTLTQNNSLHLYCGWLASALNDGGLDMMKVLDTAADIPWTSTSVKEQLWRPVQKAMTGKSSTTEQNKAEFVDIYDVLSRHISAKFGVSVQWPSRGV